MGAFVSTDTTNSTRVDAFNVSSSALNQSDTTTTATTAISTEQLSTTYTDSNTNDLSGHLAGTLLTNTTTTGQLNDTISDEDFKFNLFGTYVYPFRWLTLPTIYSWLGPLSSLAMIIGCVLPYVPQYITIRKNRNHAGFSTYVCLTLLLANILRIAFWFGHQFELPLLIQSIIMIIAQLTLLEICIRYSRLYATKKTILYFNPKHFWEWTDLSSYIVFLCLFSVLLAAAMYFFIDFKPFVEAIGYCALVTESMLGLPQVIKNYQNKSVEGMSISMVLMWLGGDSFKTGYFISNAAPYQFWLCGLLQISIDLLILFQVCLFRQNAPIKMSPVAGASSKEMMAL